jgi:hypothetical protein
VLVEWCSILLQELSGTNHWERWGLETVVSNAQVLELCLGESSRSNLKHSALVVTRRGLRKVFSKPDTRQKAIEDVVKRLTAKGSQPSTRNTVMLGVVAGVCARLPEPKEILLRQKSEFYAFYTREIIGSKAAVSPHIANGLNDFFEAFTTKDDVEKRIIPSLEKALLRAPEVVLNGLIEPFFHALPGTIDLSTILQGNLLKPLLSNIKSTNASIRHGALSTFKAIVLKCHEPDALAKVAEDILTPLKIGKLPSADQRASHAEMLAILPVSEQSVVSVTPAIATAAGKETNDVALSAETSTLLHYVKWGVSNGSEVPKPVIDIFVKGLSDKKVPVKKLWATRLGELFWDVSDPDILKSRFSSLAEAVIPALMDIWQETTSNPIAAAQSGLVTAAYVLTAIAHSKLAATSNSKVETALKKAQVERQALTMDPKPSFLLNQRIYGKLTSDDDFKWLIRALSSLSSNVSATKPDSAIAIGWSHAVIFCICSSSVKPGLRRGASQSLSKMYIESPAQISRIIVAGLWRWHQSIESGDKDSAAATSKTDNQNLHLVVKSICLPPSDVERMGGSISESVRKEQMISLLVLGRPELLPRIVWIDLCLRIGVDPGALANESADELIQQILDFTSFTETVCKISYRKHIPFLTLL